MKFHLKRQKKFFLLSLNDEKIFENFFKKTKNSNLVHGAWDEYYRDKMITTALKSL